MLSYVSPIFLSLTLHAVCFAGFYTFLDVICENKTSLLDKGCSFPIVWENQAPENPQKTLQLVKKNIVEKSTLPLKKKDKVQKVLASSPIKSSEQDRGSVSPPSANSFFPHPENLHPEYPKEAETLNLEGRALFRLTLNAKGEVASVLCLDLKFPLVLKNAAIKTLKTWRFLGSFPNTLEVPVEFLCKTDFGDDT